MSMRRSVRKKRFRRNMDEFCVPAAFTAQADTESLRQDCRLAQCQRADAGTEHTVFHKLRKDQHIREDGPIHLDKAFFPRPKAVEGAHGIALSAHPYCLRGGEEAGRYRRDGRKLFRINADRMVRAGTEDQRTGMADTRVQCAILPRKALKLLSRKVPHRIGKAQIGLRHDAAVAAPAEEPFRLGKLPRDIAPVYCHLAYLPSGCHHTTSNGIVNRKHGLFIMIFSSYRFIFLFLPAVLLGYHLLRRSGRITAAKGFLVLASLVFYGLGQPEYILTFTGSIVLNYLIAAAIGRADGKPMLRRLLLLAAVVWNIGLLVYFKYTNFLLENINFLFKTDLPLLSTILPIGISFFTFQILMYTVTFYRGEAELVSFLDYALFISFFPQLIVGPVVKEDELVPQIKGDALRSFSSADICRGILLFSVGCAKKILLANPMIDYASVFYAGDVATATTVEAWMGVLCYTFAYYFDFSGYIDMARGLGAFFGVHLPINFDSPYKARDFASFWRRWNITISRFFNEYVFDNVFHFGDGLWKLFFAVMLTFAVSGVWHGAGWHFIAWGLVNGVLVCISNYRALKMRKPLPAALAVAMTFFVSVLIRVLFDCTGLTQAGLIYRRMFSLASWSAPAALLESALTFARGNLMLCLTLAVSAVITFCCPNSNALAEKERFTLRDGVWCGFLMAVSLLNMSKVSSFLYFNF